ncbi:MAG: fibronectin type III domain-containing protein [bacterium]|nr:fibronectin type III domain-containing protein [bacterium]
MHKLLWITFILIILSPFGCGKTSDSVTSPDVDAPAISNLNISPLANGAEVSWLTDEPATSKVIYGESLKVRLVNDEIIGYTLSHRVKLTGLKAGITYYITAKPKDMFGNEADPPPQIFHLPSTQPPEPLVITGLSVVPTTDSAQITWLTNHPATTQVFYGETRGPGLSTTLASQLTTSHTVNLTGLDPDTTYYFKVESRDSTAELAFEEGDFRTNESTSTTPLTITNLSTHPTINSVQINWTTNRPATTKAFYGKTTGLGLSTTLASQLTTLHTVNLTGLNPDTTYYFKVESRDSTAELAFEEGDFRTKESVPPTPLTITNLSTNPTVNSVQINWTTNRPATTKAFYGKTTGLGLSTTLASQLTSSHTVNLTSLEPDTFYYFKVESEDANSILAQQEGSFKTTAQSEDFPLLKIVPDMKEVKVGDRFELEVRIEKVTGLFGAAMSLRFNPGIIEFEKSESGELLGKDVLAIAMEEVAGEINLGITRKAGQDEVNGSGTIVRLEFKAIGRGETDVSIPKGDLTLRNSQGELIQAFDRIAIHNGRVVVK